MLTNGSMQGVTLSAEALQENHGDTILVEEYSYPGTLSAYRNLKLDMVGVPLDEGGMRPDKVEEQLDRLSKAQRLPKFIYTISTYQNPTGFVMPAQRRKQLIELGTLRRTYYRRQLLRRCALRRAAGASFLCTRR